MSTKLNVMVVLFTIAILHTAGAYAQQPIADTLEGIPVKDITLTKEGYTYVPHFCTLVVTGQNILDNRSVYLDYGQERKWSQSATIRSTNTGKPIIFNSATDALNYMYSLDWKLVSVHTVVTEETNDEVRHYYILEAGEHAVIPNLDKK